MKNIIILSVILLTSACGVMPNQETPPPAGYKEVKCVYAKGNGRVGSWTQYVKGDVEISKISTYGTLPKNADIECKKEGVSIKVKTK